MNEDKEESAHDQSDREEFHSCEASRALDGSSESKAAKKNYTIDRIDRHRADKHRWIRSGVAMLIGENEKDFVVVVFSCFYFVSLLFNDVYGFISCNCRQVYELAFEQQRSDIEMEFSSVFRREVEIKNQQQHRKTRKKKELLNSKKIPLNIRQKKFIKFF